MDIKDYKNVWVYVEHAQGKIKNISLEVLNGGKDLAQQLGQKIIAVVIGKDAGEIAKQAASYGADEVILVEGEEYQEYNTDGYTNVLAKLITKYKPSVILLGSTNNAKDFAARAACRVKTGLIADCSNIEVDIQSKEITWVRPVFSGRALSKVVCKTRPQIATVRQGVYDKAQVTDGGSVNITVEDIRTPAEEIKTKIIDFISSGVTGVKLEDADVVVAVGGGVGKPENITIIQELADLLGGAVGSSRACVDSGWLPPNSQIGQSGKTVSPQLYIGCGISGAIQHLAGMTSSKCIVAVNKDPEAPIFEVADYYVVGDLLKVVPVLIEEIKKHKAG